MNSIAQQRIDSGVLTSPIAIVANSTIGRIIRAYWELTGVTVDDLAGPSQTPEICRHRHRLMYLIRRLDSAASYTLIGRYLGNRDMATVHQAVAKIAGEVDRIPSVSIEVGRLRELIEEKLNEARPGPLPAKPWQLLAALSVLRDEALTDAEARKAAEGFLKQLEVAHV